MTKKIGMGGMAFVLAGSVLAFAGSEPAPYRVIVNPTVVGRAMPRGALADIYLGKVERWGDGSAIVAVDLSSKSPVRAAFSRDVMQMSVDAVMHHWYTRLMRKQPPLAKSTDEDVIAFVASAPGSVGYVSTVAELPPTVREVALQ